MSNLLSWPVYYLLAHIIIWIYLRWSIQPLIDAQKKKEIVDRFGPFIRKDLDNVSLINFPLFITFIPRSIAIWGIILVGALIVCLISVGSDPKKMDSTRWWLIKSIIQFNGWIMIKVVGFSNIEHTKVEVDLRKYLGPDWVPKYEGAPTIIGNHRSWMDVVVGLYAFTPAFVGKATAKNLPGIGRVGDMLGCIYVSRVGDDAKASRADAFK